MSNNRFSICVDRVLKHEDSSYDSADPGSGRLVDHPQDPGGSTRLGITLATLRRWRGDESLTADALLDMTHDEVRQIYRANYWNAVRADSLPVGLDYAVFDFAVNSGPQRAVKVLQAFLGVEEDGVVGDVTLGAIRDFDLVYLVRAYCEARRYFLCKLPHFDAFGRGWMRRVEEVESAAVKDIDQFRPPVSEVVRAGAGAAFVAAAVLVAEVLRPPDLSPLFVVSVVSVFSVAMMALKEARMFGAVLFPLREVFRRGAALQEARYARAIDAARREAEVSARALPPLAALAFLVGCASATTTIVCSEECSCRVAESRSTYSVDFANFNSSAEASTSCGR